jgi:hypothetical protein
VALGGGEGSGGLVDPAKVGRNFMSASAHVLNFQTSARRSPYCKSLYVEIAMQWPQAAARGAVALLILQEGRTLEQVKREGVVNWSKGGAEASYVQSEAI